MAATVSTAMRWSGAEQLLRITTMVLLTRLIDPQEFGLAALALLLGSLAPLLGDLGLGAALVHEPALDRRQVDTAFLTCAAVGAALSLAVVGLAPTIAGFFGESDLRPLLPVIGTTFLLRGLTAVPRDLLRRELRLRPVARSVAIAVGLAGTAAVIAAVLGAGPWAMVVYAVGESAVALVLIAVVALRQRVWRPGLAFDAVALGGLLRFGGPLSAHQLLYYGQSHVDDVLIGRYLGAEALGLYGLAYRLMLLPIVKVADVVHAMVFPALASMQAQAERLQAAFVRAVQAVAVVSFPVSIGVVVVAPTLIQVAFGDRWSPAAVPLQVLALNGPRLVFVRLGGAAFQAVGRPTWELRITATTFALSVVAFVLGLPHGIEGVAIGYTAAGYVVLPTVLRRLARAMGTDVAALVRPLLPVMVASAAMAAVSAVVLVGLSDLADGVRLALAVLAGAVVYGAVLLHRARPMLLAVASDLRGRAAP